VGAKGLKQGAVELKRRAGGEVQMVPLDEAAGLLARLVAEGGGQAL